MSYTFDNDGYMWKCNCKDNVKMFEVTEMTKYYDNKKFEVETPEKPNVVHPAHYAQGRKYEPIDVIEDWGLNFNLGNPIKYIARAGRKGETIDAAIEDLEKAVYYTNREIERLKKERMKEIEDSD